MPDFHHADASTPVEPWRAWAESLPAAEPLAGCHRLVVLVAHPDDETLGLGGLIAWAAGHDVELDVIVASDGEGSHPDSPTHTPARLAERRRDELTEALTRLGVPPAGRHHLGLPDGGLAADEPALVAALRRVVGPDGEGVCVASLLTNDGHPDHEAVGRAAEAVARDVGASLVLAPLWVRHWGTPDDLLAPDGASWQRFDLDERRVAAKQAAEVAHASQTVALSDQPGDELLLQPGFLAHFDEPWEPLLIARGQPVQPMEDVHAEADPWGVDSRFYEARKRALTLACLPHERYGRGLELGCSTGALAAELTARVDELVAVDLSERAVAAARERLGSAVDVRRLRAPYEWPEGRFDMIVVSETGYYLTSQGLDRLIERCERTLTDDGVVVLCHWADPIEHWFLQGRDVHERFAVRPGWILRSRHREADFWLDVLSYGHQPSPAQREGLR